ncbi:hypothetical protein T439DRAFT_323363 [Meredithblackwellia eburnea MCA 4105]
MSYPPIPYPPIVQPQKQDDSIVKIGSKRRATTTATASAANPPRKQRLAFKSPLRPPGQGPSITAQIVALQKKQHSLKQAIKYSNDNSHHELKELCAKWRDYGIIASNALFELTPTPDPATLNTNYRNSSWNDSWGFACDTPDQSSSNLYRNSSYFPPPPPESASEYLSRLEDETGKSRQEILKLLEEMEENDDEPFESPEVMLETAAKRLARSKAGKRNSLGQLNFSSDMDQEKYGEDEEERVYEYEDRLTALELEREKDSRSEDDAVTAMNGEEMDLDDGEEEEKWNVGSLLRNVGVDPSVFGWDDDQGDFSSLEVEVEELQD